MKRLLLTILLFSAVSCIYDYDIPSLPEAKDALVFDGNIAVGSKATLKVSRLAALDGSAPARKVEPASWWVEDDAATRYDTDSDGSVDLSAAPSDKAYRMVIECEDKTYVSDFQTPLAAPQIDSLTFSETPTNVNCNISFCVDPSVSRYAVLQFEEIWRFHTDYEKFLDVSYDNEEGRWNVFALENPDLTYYECWAQRKTGSEFLVDLGSLDGKAVNYVVNTFPRTSHRNHGNYNIKVWVRSISDKEYRYAQTLNQQDGGLNLYTPNPGEIAGNIVCEDDPSQKVYGYVSTSFAVSTTKRLDNRFYIYAPSVYGLEIPANPEDYGKYLANGYWPIKWDSDGNLLWGPERCINCVAAGGTLDKPSFSE